MTKCSGLFQPAGGCGWAVVAFGHLISEEELMKVWYLDFGPDTILSSLLLVQLQRRSIRRKLVDADVRY